MSTRTVIIGAFCQCGQVIACESSGLVVCGKCGEPPEACRCTKQPKSQVEPIHWPDLHGLVCECADCWRWQNVFGSIGPSE